VVFGDGVKWEQVTPSAGWSPRLAAGLVEHRGRMWMLGGTENYYFGDDTSLKNDVWSSADGKAWKQETAKAAWSPRAYHQAVTLNDKSTFSAAGTMCRLPREERRVVIERWRELDLRDRACAVGAEFVVQRGGVSRSHVGARRLVEGQRQLRRRVAQRGWQELATT
jgi:hypothetical protein